METLKYRTRRRGGRSDVLNLRRWTNPLANGAEPYTVPHFPLSKMREEAIVISSLGSHYFFFPRPVASDFHQFEWIFLPTSGTP